MSATEAKVELVTYKTDDIKQATQGLFYYFINGSGIQGISQWAWELDRLFRRIDSQKTEPFSLEAEGIEVSFSGFPNPRPRLKEEGLIYEAKEPHFTILDPAEGISPRERTRIARATSDIAGEMKDVFHMRVEYPPYTLVFSKERFAKSRVIFNAALLH